MFKVFKGLGPQAFKGDKPAIKMKAGFEPDRVNPLHISITGFTTDPDGECNGMRKQSEQYQARYPGSDFIIWAWDQMGWGEAKAIEECKAMHKIMQLGNWHGPYTHFLLDGHSFGGGYLAFFLHFLEDLQCACRIDLARYIDPVKNPFDDCPWTVPMTIVDQAMQFVQHNGMGFWFKVGPNGTALLPDNVAESHRLITTVFPSEFVPTINHISIITDPRVWDISWKMMCAVTDEKRS